MSGFNARQVLYLTLTCFAAAPALATQWTVGDVSGWTLGYDYASWVAGKNFQVGDSLVFIYGITHSVEQVTVDNYNSCTTTDPISSDNSGNTTIPLQTPGPFYFICGTAGHCSEGMALAVTVTGEAPSTKPPTGRKAKPPISPAVSPVAPSPSISPAAPVPSVSPAAPVSSISPTPAGTIGTSPPPSNSTQPPPPPSSSGSLSTLPAVFFTLGAMVVKLVFF